MLEVRKIVDDWYEPERQDRCKEWIYRNKVRPTLGISARTFWRYISPDMDSQDNTSAPVQLSLF